MSNNIPARVQPGTSDGGQFAAKAREEAEVRLVVPKPSALKEHFKPRPARNPRRTPAPVAPAPTTAQRQGAYIEKMIAAGDLAPAARGMGAREAIDQWAEANAASYGERVDHLAGAGLLPEARADRLGPGEAVDLEPILSAREDVDQSALEAAQRDYAELSSVTANPDGSVTLVHTQGSTVVPGDLQVAYEVDDNRCVDCGIYTGGALCDC